MSLANLVDGSIASCAAAVVTNPVEVVKTRLQLQGELMKEGQYVKKYNGMLDGLRVVAKNEGIWGLQKGLPASFAHQVCQNGIRFACYPPIRGQMENAFGPGFAANLAAGGVVGVISAISGSPAFMVKIRLQAQCAASAAQVGTQHNYSGFLDATYSILKEKGITGLFHGYRTACVRTSVGSSVQLASYDTMKTVAARKTKMQSDDVRVHLLSSTIAGVGMVVAMNPFDVLITRCYNNPHQKDTVNIFGAFRQILQTEGPKGLYKGATGLFLRMTPHTILTFMFLEQLRSLRAARQLA